VPSATAASSGVKEVSDFAYRIEIKPEPSAAEREAILIALERLQEFSGESGSQSPSAWAMAGRREALRDRTASDRPGWGRASHRRDGW
jgi:hypothetical protein